ncbi:MAG: type IV secretion protein Rhs [Enterobacter asburiae]|nr:type IV secretion protein Rhs [Enterobacter asburiae]
MMSLWDALRMNMMISYQELVRTFPYSLDKVDLLHYGLEQQASIVSDYWLLKYFGLDKNQSLLQYRDLHLKETLYYLLNKYKTVLKGLPG